MVTASATAVGNRTGVLPRIFLGGTIAGVLDLLMAVLDTRLRSGQGPSVVLKAIASGLPGTHAFFRGTGTAFLGLVLHFFIAFAWASYFGAAAVHWSVLTRRAMLCGALYGAIVYAVMQRVVLPSSAYPKPLWQGISFGHIAIGLGAYACSFGSRIALSMWYCLTGGSLCNWTAS